MEHLFVPHIIALSLKEKGFDEPCLTYYYDGGRIGHNSLVVDGFKNTIQDPPHKNCTAPLWQQVIDWFREKHFIIIEIQCDQTTYPKFCYEVFKYKNFANWERKTNIENWGLYPQYYEALKNGISQALTII